jgi:hypothetical protein
MKLYIVSAHLICSEGHQQDVAYAGCLVCPHVTPAPGRSSIHSFIATTPNPDVGARLNSLVTEGSGTNQFEHTEHGQGTSSECFEGDRHFWDVCSRSWSCLKSSGNDGAEQTGMAPD